MRAVRVVIGVALVAGGLGWLAWRIVAPDAETRFREACLGEIGLRRAGGPVEAVEAGVVSSAGATLDDFMGWADSPALKARDEALISAGGAEGAAVQALADVFPGGNWTVLRWRVVWRGAAGQGAAVCSLVVPGAPAAVDLVRPDDIRLDGLALRDELAGLR